MSILETVLIFVGIPVLVIAIVAGLSFMTKKSPGFVPTEYRLGERWTHQPVLWSAVDEVTTHGHHAAHAVGADAIGGSASGKW
ncbi:MULTISPECIES: hypothetical protein [Prescottella]|uniref:Uncharacterized protein n=3 Tax=Rhodococcus hoagii TaxID=43767 RepID=E9T4D9_RHOHA|nr:hypothetical protein [Prescottella equi]MBU4613581.1 hypothetical protein [Rhodococcus sp. GG48]MCD7051521.1 hypothetical protein [Rhodococcus sp. BH2-1]GBF13221.1 hypothetical protein Br6_00574 [Rhodococcus sp. Br-6]AVP69272.1 hypothetical protein C7H75_15855 [Prescottella equi]EGD22935.1 hypothetical protein HMPREF0724_13483 [Prescottella equi ATCC 33707]